MAAMRSSGNTASSRCGSEAIASAVRTPHPPAVVSTATRGPRGNGWVAKVAAASKASSAVDTWVTPSAAHTPSKTRWSAASAPVWLAAARAPPSLAPPFRITIGFVRAA